MKNRHLYALLVAFCFSACQNQSKVNTINKNLEPIVKDASLQKVPIDAVLGIESMSILDSMIVCRSANTDRLFYCLDRKTFAVIDSMGTKGGGADEFVAPHFVAGANDWMIVDNGKRDIVWVKENVKIRKVPLNIQSTLSAPMLYSDSLMCFIENYPNELIWELYNYETGKIVDKVTFKDEEQKGNAYLYDFAYGIGPDYLAIAQLNFNKIFIYKMKNKKMELRSIVQGIEEEGKLYYSNITCLQDRIYALYQGHVDLDNKTGESVIEVYSLDGELLELLKTNIIADRFLLDKENNRILLLSPFDDDHIYWVSLK